MLKPLNMQEDGGSSISAANKEETKKKINNRQTEEEENIFLFSFVWLSDRHGLLAQTSRAEA